MKYAKTYYREDKIMYINTINRYTNLASLVAILKNKELTLLDPLKWEDQNDAHYLRKYGEKKRFNSLYALCFTTAAETSHHWKVFAPGADGVCIKINMNKFLSYLKSIKKNEPSIAHGKVEYKYLEDVENKKTPLRLNRLPFIKRAMFRDELEYRVILGKKNKESKKSYGIEFDISIIDRIVLSNSLPYDLRKPMVSLLKSIDGCKNLSIIRSTLNDNGRWKKACERAE